MADISETIQQPLEAASKSRINALVALFVAITATFMAICNVKDGNIVQAMDQSQAHAIDSWSYYQAKSTKESIAENTLQLVKLQNAANSDSTIKYYQAQVARYDKEKAEIKTEAEGYTKNNEYFYFFS